MGNVDVLNTTPNCTPKNVKMVNFMLCLFIVFRNRKNHWGENNVNNQIYF